MRYITITTVCICMIMFCISHAGARQSKLQYNNSAASSDDRIVYACALQTLSNTHQKIINDAKNSINQRKNSTGIERNRVADWQMQTLHAIQTQTNISDFTLEYYQNNYDAAMNEYKQHSHWHNQFMRNIQKGTIKYFNEVYEKKIRLNQYIDDMHLANSNSNSNYTLVRLIHPYIQEASKEQ